MKFEMDDDARRIWQKNADSYEQYDVLALMSWALYRTIRKHGIHQPQKRAVEYTIQWMESHPGQVMDSHDENG